MAVAKKKSTKTITPGAVKGGANDKYQFKMAALKVVDAGTGYSTSHGGLVEGDRIQVGYIHKPRGTGARLHWHNNEQLNYVVRGTLIGSVNGVKVRAPAGSLVYIPAKAPHSLVADPKGEDVIFLAIKDMSQGIVGMAVDGTMSGPLYLKGFDKTKGQAKIVKRLGKSGARVR
ncbi:MAG: cupin domain-containing protein [Betaproteobacteria bacterium]|nr:cupin domain-containing protein [Betaproteobacteria bacterium]